MRLGRCDPAHAGGSIRVDPSSSLHRRDGRGSCANKKPRPARRRAGSPRLRGSCVIAAATTFPVTIPATGRRAELGPTALAKSLGLSSHCDARPATAPPSRATSALLRLSRRPKDRLAPPLPAAAVLRATRLPYHRLRRRSRRRAARSTQLGAATRPQRYLELQRTQQPPVRCEPSPATAATAARSRRHARPTG